MVSLITNQLIQSYICSLYNLNNYKVTFLDLGLWLLAMAIVIYYKLWQEVPYWTRVGVRPKAHCSQLTGSVRGSMAGNALSKGTPGQWPHWISLIGGFPDTHRWWEGSRVGRSRETLRKGERCQGQGWEQTVVWQWQE